MGICQSYIMQMAKPESLSAAQYRKNATEPALFIILPWYCLIPFPEHAPESLLEDYRVDTACYCYSTCCENQSCEQSYHRAADKDGEKEEKKGKEEEEYNLKAKVSELYAPLVQDDVIQKIDDCSQKEVLRLPLLLSLSLILP